MKIIATYILFILPFALLAQDPATRVIAEVNDINITELEVRHFISRQSKPVKQSDAIQEMINVELLTQAANEDGFIDNPFLQLELKRTEKALIASLYLQQFLRDLEISEEMLKARYASEVNPDDYVESEYNANHILLKTEQQAKEIITRLNQGEAFTELAKTHSTGPSGKDGGALGWFSAGDMVPEFSAATARLASGHYSKTPVQTQFGWHVILLNEQRKSEPPTFEAMKKDLRTLIAAEAIRNKVSSLRNNANVNIKVPQ